ncbi:MAG TPA: gluconate 2-dehydrogenase subunit 3 family protein [Blastocatellia bacterium]|nr:gluconate 2-dehydrogenase subunit 3 family protein [Blastocatellia bacterium]
MSEEKDITRREAIKNIGVGVSVIATLPVLGQGATAHDHAHPVAQRRARSRPKPLRFFTPEENRAVIELTERIIPADESSPGAKAARVNEFIDFMVSESPAEIKKQWRDGLAAINKMSREKFGVAVSAASVEQQVELLKEISKNERSPQTVEERFFRLIKNATIDGYYTSEIGIHQELRYKGNSYLKEFVGCNHPEHQQ